MSEPEIKPKLDRPELLSPGKLLGNKRKEHDWDIEDVASDLLLSVSQVKALEADDYQQLPGATYIIGYWRSYASLLGIEISDAIEAHKLNLDAPSAAIALDPNHLRAHGHQEKSRKKSALLFCLLSAAFLGGIWYWQYPEDNPINQWIENQANRQLSILNSNDNSDSAVLDGDSTVSNGAQSQENRAVSSISADQNQQSVSALPVPNFSDEFDNNNAQVQEYLEDGGNIIQLESSASSNQQSQNNIILIEESQIINLQAIETIGGEREEQDLMATTENASLSNTNTEAVEFSDEPKVNDNDLLVSQNDNVGSVNVTDGGQALALLESQGETEQDPDLELIQAGEENYNQQGEWEINSPDWLEFAIEKETWLDVRDNRGEKLIYRTVSAGETLQLSGQPPFSVFVGAAEGVSVKYMGSPVEFTAHKSGLFARFKVGQIE